MEWLSNLTCAMTQSELMITYSEIEGRGLFADRDYQANEELFRFHGIVVVRLMQVDSLVWAHRYPNAIGIGDDRWLDPELGSPATFINHSCSPNARVARGQTVISHKPMLRGAEITIDYSLTESDPAWELTCYCLQPLCRGILRASLIPYWKL